MYMRFYQKVNKDLYSTDTLISWILHTVGPGVGSFGHFYNFSVMTNNGWKVPKGTKLFRILTFDKSLNLGFVA